MLIFTIVIDMHILSFSMGVNTSIVVSVSSDSEAMRPRRQASPFRHQIGSQQQVPPLPAQSGRGYRNLSLLHSESSVDYQKDRVSTPKVLEYL